MSKQCLVFETMNQINEMKVAKESNGLMTLTGVFGVCGKRNNNNRVYETKNYASMVTEMQSRIKESGGVAGELEHPNTMNVNLENISHKVTEINIDESGTVTGTIQLLNTPKGKIAQAIVEGGLPLYVSSRAMGEIDKSGNVKLSKLATYDLVGSPGFSEARMHLNESQCFESLSDNICVISEKSDDNPTNEPTNEDMNKEVLEKIEALEARIQDLEDQNDELREQLQEAQAGNIDLKKLADGIQKWIIEDYSPTVQKWITEEYAEQARQDALQMFAEEIAPKIEKWIIEQYSPEIEKWVTEEFAPEVEKWIVEQYSPGVQNWIVKHFAPEIEQWMNESYSEHIKDMIQEGLKDNKESKLKSITETLKLLEGMEPVKPQFGSRTIVNEQKEDEPLYIQQMPENIRPKYNMAAQEVKESIQRRAKLYDFNVEGAIQRFWESIDFDNIKPAKSVYEGLDGIEDERERAIRAAFRRHRRF